MQRNHITGAYSPIGSIEMKLIRRDGTSVPIAHAVESNLDGNDYGLGELESLSSEVNNLSSAFGMLIEKLSDRNVLDNDDVEDFINTYEHITLKDK